LVSLWVVNEIDEDVIPDDKASDLTFGFEVIEAATGGEFVLFGLFKQTRQSNWAVPVF
jgi:hypothetical protein